MKIGVGVGFEMARKTWRGAGGERPPRLVTAFWFAPVTVLDAAGRRRSLTKRQRRIGRASRDAVRMIEDLGADEVLLVSTTADPDEVDRVADVLGWLHVFAIKHRRAGRRTRLRP